MSVDVKKYKFGIIGMGFLGNSIAHVFNLQADIKMYDKYKNFDSIEDMVDGSEFIWVCLPTPMRLSNGKCDLSIVYENVSMVNRLSKKSDNRIVVIKSTVPPGTCRDLQSKFDKITILSCPEFLTARASLINSITPSRIIIGSKEKENEEAKRLEEIFRYRFGNAVNIFQTEWEKSEICKYGANVFFAVKISYFNLIYSMCEELKIDFNEVRDLICSDGRIGISHNNVPGWDGQRGYSGSCFPKDINALIKFAEDIGVNPELIKASWSQNLRDRPSRDWENIPSAVSNKDGDE